MSLQQPRNADQIKERIMFFVRTNGPSLPIQVSRRIQMDGIFTAAFLSELLGEKRLKMTNMRVGSSPVYYIEGQEAQIEKFGAEHLKSKEKEAFFLIKEKKFLKDSEQEPAIRVALRAIKDFALPFTKNSESYWRYYLVEEKDFYMPLEEKKQKEPVENKVEKIEEKEIHKEEGPQKELTIVEEKKFLKFVGKKEEKPIAEKPKTEAPQIEPTEEISEKQPKTKTKKKPSTKTKSKQDEKFLERVKEFLSKKSVAILNIEGFSKDHLLLRIKVKGEEQLLVAYNKKKITESEIISAAKKANELDLRYSILSLGELPKRVNDLMDALKNLKEIERVE